MSTSINHCELTEQILIDSGFKAIEQNPSASAHIAGCAQCQSLLRAWQQIPELLSELPEAEPAEALMQRAAAPPKRSTAIAKPRRLLAPSLASAAVLLACVGLSSVLLREDALHYPSAPPLQELAVRDQRDGDSLDQLQTAAQKRDQSSGFGANSSERGVEAGTIAPTETAEISASALDEEEADGFGDYGGISRHRGSRGVEANQADDADLTELTTVTVTGTRIQSQTITAASPVSEVSRSDLEYFLPSDQPVAGSDEQRLRARANSQGAADADQREAVVGALAAPQEGPSEGASAPPTRQLSEQLRLEPEPEKEQIGDRLAKAKKSEKQNAELAATLEREESTSVAEAKPAPAKSAPASRATELRTPTVSGGVRMNPDGIGQALIYPDGASKDISGFGVDLLADYEQTVGVKTQPATGYWANRYVPGDPQIRWLSARLAQRDRSWLQDAAPLERSVSPIAQPFDAPADNALALSVMADANAVLDAPVGPTRMRVQVGIRGIDRRGGQRPPMSLGVVVDLPVDAPDALRIASRSLIDALLQSKQSGDRFSLVVTGVAGESPGAIVAAEDFRFGPLQLAQQAFLAEGDEQADDRAEPAPLDLYGAVERAGAMVQQSDDPSKPLGSSAVIVISGQPVEDLQRLLALTHRRAKDGITLSVFALGAAQSAQAQELALAGLGNRRFLVAPSQARQLIEDELYASSRAVARAARLSVRLAPGVRLIEVIGSERLNPPQAQRVREIERSMDQRLATNLGIQADRGEDEGGIQIVIPSIYSGDSVTVLLDLLVDRPGAIVDVSLRYKDLVFLHNGSLHSHLTLPEGGPKRGPRELAVQKNLLAHHFVVAVEEAAAELGRGQVDRASALLRALHASIGLIRERVPAWELDPDLIADQQLLDRYLNALAASQETAHEAFLSDSLRYAAWAKTHRGLEALEEQKQ